MSQRWSLHFKTQEPCGVLSIPKIHLKQLKWEKKEAVRDCAYAPGYLIFYLGWGGVGGSWKRKTIPQVSAHPSLLLRSHSFPSVIKTKQKQNLTSHAAWCKRPHPRHGKRVTISLSFSFTFTSSTEPLTPSGKKPLACQDRLSYLYMPGASAYSPHGAEVPLGEKDPWISGRPFLWLLSQLAIHFF